MKSFIFRPNDPEEEDMNVRSSLEGPFPEPYHLSQDNNVAKSALLRRKNNSLANSVIRSQKDQGIIFGAKFSDQRDEEPEQYSRVSRSVKIDCSGPADIINNPDILANEYVPNRSKINDQTSLAAPLFRYQQSQRPKSEISAQKHEANRRVSQKVKDEDRQTSQQKKNDGKSNDVNKRFTIIFIVVLLLLILQIQSEPLKQWTSRHIAEPFSSGFFR